MESDCEGLFGTVIPPIHSSHMDNLEGLALGRPAITYYHDATLKIPVGLEDGGPLYYYHPSPLEKEIRRIFDRATNQLTKQTA